MQIAKHADCSSKKELIESNGPFNKKSKNFIVIAESSGFKPLDLIRRIRKIQIQKAFS